jgi:hypothetical protein
MTLKKLPVGIACFKKHCKVVRKRNTGIGYFKVDAHNLEFL